MSVVATNGGLVRQIELIASFADGPNLL
jgi:hypothetical protein